MASFMDSMFQGNPTYAAIKKNAAVSRANPYAVDMNAYNQNAAAALPQMYAPAYQQISAQFTPQMAQARNYIQSNPAMANSGAGARLNRQLLQGAYGQLAGSMGETSGAMARGGVDLLSSLIQRRREQEYQKQMAQYQRKMQGGIGSALGGVVGAGLGAFGGPLLGAVGTNVGSKIFK